MAGLVVQPSSFEQYLQFSLTSTYIGSLIFKMMSGVVMLRWEFELFDTVGDLRATGYSNMRRACTVCCLPFKNSSTTNTKSDLAPFTCIGPRRLDCNLCSRFACVLTMTQYSILIITGCIFVVALCCFCARMRSIMLLSLISLWTLYKTSCNASMFTISFIFALCIVFRSLYFSSGVGRNSNGDDRSLVKFSTRLLSLHCWFLSNLFNGDWFITFWIASMVESHVPVEVLHCDKHDLVIRITSLHRRSMVPLSNELYGAVKRCLIFASWVKLVINDETKWEPWIATNYSMQPKQAIHLDTAIKVASLLASLLEYNQV